MNNQEDNYASYISEMTVQLAEMARTDGFGPLAYILDMAALEARSADERIRGAERHPV